MPDFKVYMLAPKRARVEIYDLLGPSMFGMIDAKSISEAIATLGELDTIELRINSRGGSAFEGLAIASLLADHPARVEAKVDGVAGSAATLITAAADSVEMPKNALFFIHDPVPISAGAKLICSRASRCCERRRKQLSRCMRRKPARARASSPLL
jgi:ATP-dependent Clp protease protease subunit